MKISKIYLRICSLLFACFLVCGSILRPVVTYASPYDLMIGSSSNALMTLELDDSDYLMMSPRSSIASINNTVDYRSMRFYVYLVNAETGTLDSRYYDIISDDGSYRFYVPEGYQLGRFGFQYLSGGLPSPGVYRFRIDNSSDVSFDDTGRFDLYSYYSRKNVEAVDNHYNVTPSVQLTSGDFYFDTVYKIGTLDSLLFYWALPEFIPSGSLIAGTVKTNFSISNDEPIYSAVNVTDNSSDGYYGDVSSSLSDLSSSVDSMTEDLSSAAENLEYISTSQNLIIQGIDNVILHISDQLYAFWDQLFNLIHLPTMAKMDDIISAIQNMDLEIEVNLDGLKTTINNMSTAVQNKLQSVTNTITGGFDNSGIEQNGNELDSSITEFEEAEQNVLESVNDSLNDFEFDADLSEYKNIVQVISDFLQELYDSSGGFKLVINLSLMLSVASIVIGVYRFKEGG